MKNRTEGQRTGPMRYILLILVIGIVGIAFWKNTERQLAIVMKPKYIIGNVDLLQIKEQQRYNTALARFKTSYGISAQLIFADSLDIEIDATRITFIVSVLNEQGSIVFPTVLRTVFSTKEKQILNTAMVSAVATERWQQDVLRIIEDVYLLLGESSAQ